MINHSSQQSSTWGVHPEEERLYVSQFGKAVSRTLVKGTSVHGDQVHVYLRNRSLSPELVVARYKDKVLLAHQFGETISMSMIPKLSYIEPGSLDPVLADVFINMNRLPGDTDASGPYQETLHSPVLEDLDIPSPFS